MLRVSPLHLHQRFNMPLAGVVPPAIASGINIDQTAPTATASVSPEPNGNGWHNSDVTVSFSGTDDLSEIDSCSDDVLLTGDGAVDGPELAVLWGVANTSRSHWVQGTTPTKAFEEAYTRYEEKAARGEMNVAKTIKANDLWRKMLGMLN